MKLDRVTTRPLRGALFFSASLFAAALNAQTNGAEAVLVPSQTTEQLRVFQVGDQLVDFLNKAVAWVDKPKDRVGLSSLRDVVQAAINSHPEVLLAGEQRISASLGTDEAFSAFLPQVSTNLDQGKRKYDAVTYPTNIPAYEKTGVAYGITLRQLLYDFGGAYNRYRAQKVRETASDQRMEAKRSELALRAMMAWHELFRAQQNLQLNVQNVASRQQILSFIQEREELGGSSKGDVLRVQARLTDAQAALVVAENRLRAAEAVFWEIFNSSPPELIALPEVVQVDFKRYENVQAVLAKNAVLGEIRSNAEAAGLESKAATANLLPGFYLELNNTRRDIGGEGLPGTDRTAMVVARYNLFTGGGDLARKRLADQKAAEAWFDMQSQTRQLERTLTQVLAEVKNSTVAVKARKEAVQVASQALGAVREQFAFRRGSLLDLLRGQEDVYVAGRDLIDSVADQALARYRLLHLGMELLPIFDTDLAAPVSVE